MRISELGEAGEALARYPSFPAIVAGWFAALFGIGTLVLPIGVFESLSVGSGIASIVEAAQPPLGTTARTIIALLAASLGAALGIFLARRVTAQLDPASPAKTPAKAADPATPRPISAREELGSERLDDPVDVPAFLAPMAEVLDEEDDDPVGSEIFEGPPANWPNDVPDTPFAIPPVPPLDETDTLAEPEVDDTAQVNTQPSEPAQANSEPKPTPAEAPLDGDLNQLSLAQLIERFAKCLETHRSAAAASVAVAEPDIVEDVRPSFDLGIEPDEVDETDEAFADSGYSSLLAMSRPKPPKPATVEPAQLHSSDRRDAKLREALTTLDELSKAG